MPDTFKDQITSDVLFKDFKEDIALSATFEITHKCNFHCVHCYGAFERAERDLSFDQIVSILDQLYEHGTLDLSLTGGEPLSRPDFCEIYRYARCRGMFVSVLTNATLLKQEHVEAFIEYPVSELSITMYGYTPEIYERMTGAEGSHAKFMAAVNLLKLNDIPFELKSVATQINKHEMFAIREFADRLGVESRYSTKLIPENNGCESPLAYALTPEEALWFEVNDPNKRRAWEYAVGNLEEQHEHRNARSSEGMRFLCHAGDKAFTISASGRMYLCLNERREGYDVLAGSVSEGYDTLIKRIRSEKAPDDYKCLSCPDLDYCDHCAAEIGLIGDFDFGNESTCILARLRHERFGP